jgi:hypothetical protein
LSVAWALYPGKFITVLLEGDAVYANVPVHATIIALQQSAILSGIWTASIRKGLYGFAKS